MVARDEALEQALARLRQYRDKLAKDLAAVERSIEILGGEEDAPQPTVVETSEFARLKPQEAAESFLRQHPDKSFKANRVAKELRRLGFQTKAKAWSTVIYSALNRLAEKGIATKTKQNGVFVYRIKNEPEAVTAASGS